MLRSPLLHFLLIGALLFGLRLPWSTAAGTSPVVLVDRGEIENRIAAFAARVLRPVTEAEARAIEDQVIDDALWFAKARALGLAETDSVVRQRLVLNMRFLLGETDESDEELHRRAVDLGMDESDLVVRRRLVDRAQALVRARIRSEPMDEAALRRYFESNRERWREPPLLDLTHVYFSRDRRGNAAEGDARALLDRLRREKTSPEIAVRLGDPFLGGHSLHLATPNRIVARLGPGFAKAVAKAPVDRWLGPIDSAFGVHLVWIEARRESRIPPFAEIRDRIEQDWIADRTRRALRSETERLRREIPFRLVGKGRIGASEEPPTDDDRRPFAAEPGNDTGKRPAPIHRNQTASPSSGDAVGGSG